MKKIFTVLALVFAMSINASNENLLNSAYGFEVEKSIFITKSSKEVISIDKDKVSTGNNSIKFAIEDLSTVDTKDNWQVMLASGNTDENKANIPIGNYVFTTKIFVSSDSFPSKIMTAFTNKINLNGDGYQAFPFDIPTNIEKNKWVTLSQNITLEKEIKDAKLSIKLAGSIIPTTGYLQFYLDDFSIQEDNQTSIEKNNILSNISVTTDYNSDNIIISNLKEEKAKFFLYNIFGQLVCQKQLNFSTSNIKFTNQETGIYFIKIKSSGKTYTTKILWK